MLWSALIDSARTQHGLITSGQARALGMSARVWARAVTLGDLELVHPNVALLPGATLDHAARIHAATLSLGPGALASHRSAGHLWGAEVPTDVVDVIVDNRAPRQRRAGVVIHRPRDLNDLRPLLRQNIPTTNPLRVLLDIGAVDPKLTVACLEHFVSEGLISIAAARNARARHARRGRTGLRALDDAIDTWALGERPPDSVLEPRVARFLAENGFHGFVFHPVVDGIELDFGHLELRIDLEFDGWATHRARAQFERDRERDLRLVASGWRVVRLTWLRFTRRPQWCRDHIARVLDRARHRPG
jgi:very-short-patch-repair endonuclease